MCAHCAGTQVYGTVYKVWMDCVNTGAPTAYPTTSEPTRSPTSKCEALSITGTANADIFAYYGQYIDGHWTVMRRDIDGGNDEDAILHNKLPGMASQTPLFFRNMHFECLDTEPEEDAEDSMFDQHLASLNEPRGLTLDHTSEQEIQTLKVRNLKYFPSEPPLKDSASKPTNSQRPASRKKRPQRTPSATSPKHIRVPIQQYYASHKLANDITPPMRPLPPHKFGTFRL